MSFVVVILLHKTRDLLSLFSSRLLPLHLWSEKKRSLLFAAQFKIILGKASWLEWGRRGSPVTLSRIEHLSGGNNSQFKSSSYNTCCKRLTHVKNMLILVLCQAHGEDSHGWDWQSEILGFNPSSDVRNIIWVNLFASQSFNFSFVKSPWKIFLTHWSFLLSKIIFAFTGWCGVWLILVSKHQFNLLSPLWVFGVST